MCPIFAGFIQEVGTYVVLSNLPSDKCSEVLLSSLPKRENSGSPLFGVRIGNFEEQGDKGLIFFIHFSFIFPLFEGI